MATYGFLDVLQEELDKNFPFDYEISWDKRNHAVEVSFLLEAQNPAGVEMLDEDGEVSSDDILFEEAANELNFTVIDGFSFTYKPKFDIDIFEWNLVKNIPNIRTKEVEYKKNIINLLKIHGSLTWEIEDEDIYRGLQNEIDNPVMVFPSSKKYYQSYQKPYFELFSKNQNIF